MSKKNGKKDEMLDHYDFSGGVRGKYVDRLKKNGQLVLLEPDIAKVFTTSESVNNALRKLLPAVRTPRASRSLR